MTKQEIEIAKKHLAIFERQKQKYEMYIEETQAVVEELTTFCYSKLKPLKLLSKL